MGVEPTSFRLRVGYNSRYTTVPKLNMKMFQCVGGFEPSFSQPEAEYFCSMPCELNYTHKNTFKRPLLPMNMQEDSNLPLVSLAPTVLPLDDAILSRL